MGKHSVSVFIVANLSSILEVCVGMSVLECVCALVRHVKDSRRCSEIQWWACFITSHIETNLCPFTWRTASYSLTKLARQCGVRGPLQARTSTPDLTTHTQSQRQVQAVMQWCAPPHPRHASTHTCLLNLMSLPSLFFFHILTHTHTRAHPHGPLLEPCGCGVIAVTVAGCVFVPLSSLACRPPPCGTMWHRSQSCSVTWLTSLFVYELVHHNGCALKVANAWGFKSWTHRSFMLSLP